MTQIGYINQIICTIQGEGNCVGYPVILIRFNGCNLNCSMCDSKYTWNNNNPYSFSDIELQINKVIDKYPNIKNLMVTGGEPFCQPKLLEFIVHKYNQYNIQIETNGFNIESSILKKINSPKIQLIISPKLQLKDYKTNISFYQIIESFNALYLMLLKYNIKYIFKLVYCEELKDKILTFYNNIMLFDRFNFWVMPLTPNYSNADFDSKYKQSCFDTIEFCKDYGFNYSPRIHVDLFKSASESTA